MKTPNKKQISATDFKKHFLQLVDEVTNKKNSFIITKRKTPVAQVLPLENDTLNHISHFGCMKGIIKIKEDIVNSSFESDWDINNE